ncbi:MAG: DUF2877 domain-containing protein [Chloroflexi bacterium]|nr:DUF2877 domain-containing protein [Chloroflexota bacterium]MBU1748429.1 DUF2877 domain-containing protein [Chloroflexota bacterium]
MSISRTVAGVVRAPGFQARVLHSFARAIDLLTDDGTVVSVVDAAVGDGPLNVVVGAPAPFAGVAADAVVRGDGEWLRVGRLTVHLASATLWEPHWPWERRLEAVSHQRSAVNLCGWSVSLNDRVAEIAQRAVGNLRAALQSDDRRKLAEAAGALAGLGPGLTPAGDDFLAGVMWGLRFSGERDVDALCAAIVDAAGPRTTPLSAALLRAAGAGLADARWHALLDALDRGVDISGALEAVLSQGATSGADAWAGFQLANQIR